MTARALGTLAFLALAGAGCLRADDRVYACAGDLSCPSPLRCVGGFCVESSGGGAGGGGGGGAGGAAGGGTGGGVGGASGGAGGGAGGGQAVPDAGPGEICQTAILVPRTAGGISTVEGFEIEIGIGALPTGPGRIRITGTSAGHANDTSTCGGPGPDVFFNFEGSGYKRSQFAGPLHLWVDGGSHTLSLQGGCGAAPVCQGTESGNLTLPPGQYTVGVDTTGDGGPFELNIEGSVPGGAYEYCGAERTMGPPLFVPDAGMAPFPFFLNQAVEPPDGPPTCAGIANFNDVVLPFRFDGLATRRVTMQAPFPLSYAVSTAGCGTTADFCGLTDGGPGTLSFEVTPNDAGRAWIWVASSGAPVTMGAPYQLFISLPDGG